MEQGNKVRPSSDNAFEIISTVIDEYKIAIGDELAILHPPLQSEAYDFLLLLSIESSIGVQAKCVLVLTAPMIRDEIVKTCKVIPTGGRMVLLIITSGIIIKKDHKQYIHLSPGIHKLEKTTFKVPSNMDVVVVSTAELYKRNAITRQDMNNVQMLLELKKGKDVEVENVGHFFDILKGRPLSPQHVLNQ